jgi:TonB family protein
MTWAHYLLQVNIYLVICYAFYKLFLEKETYFLLNRIYLLAAGMLSLAIPFIRPEWFIRQSVTHQIGIDADQLNMVMAQVSISAEKTAQFNWGQLVAGIYLAGMLFFMARFIFRLFAVQRLIKNKPAGMAFSFFKQKVIDHSFPDQDIINKHEDIHMRQLHTIDVLFFELLGILNWYNPVVYLYKTTVKNIHEYLADEEAADFQGDKETYAMLLLSKAFGVDQNTLTNGFFNKSLIKQRIFMLHKKRSKRVAIMKYGLFLPLFAAMLLFSSATISKNKEIKAMAEEISVDVTNVALPGTIPALKEKDEESWAAFYAHLSNKISYPKAAENNGLQGNTVVKFVVSNGGVSDISVNTALGMGCDAAVMKTVLDFDDFKHIKDGKYGLKVTFRLLERSTPVKNAAAELPAGYTPLYGITVSRANGSRNTVALPKTQKVYDFVSITKQPGFPGGMEKFYQYLAANAKYPQEARAANIEGKVFLSFVVETDGELSDIKVERKLGGGTDEEAVRLLKESPKWTPGYMGDQTVRVKYNIPVSFTLNKNEEPKTTTITGYTSSRRGALPANSPVYIIDGVRIYDSSLSKITPNEIESINVLKDDDAVSAYGQDGRNGVIMVTTKKGVKLNSLTPILRTGKQP